MNSENEIVVCQALIRVQVASTLKGVISQILLPRASGENRIAAIEILVVNPVGAHQQRRPRAICLWPRR